MNPENPEGPHGLWIEVGKDCDKNCVRCFNAAGTECMDLGEEPLRLTPENYIHILTSFKNAGGKKVAIPGAGEPLLGKNYELTKIIMDFCGENELELVIFTSGTLTGEDGKQKPLDERMIEELDRPYVSLKLKFDSFKSKIQDDAMVRIAGYTKAREKTLEKLIPRFAGYMDTEGKSRLSFVTSIMTINYNEIPEIWRYCRSNGINPDIDTNLEKGKGATCGVSEENKKVKAMFNLLQKIDKEEYGREWYISPTYAGGCCDRLLKGKHIYIDRFGNASPCLGAKLSGVIIGNAKEESLIEVYNSPLMQKVGNKENYEGPCTKCSNFKEEKCNSCAGRYMDEITEDRIHTIGCWNFRK